MQYSLREKGNVMKPVINRLGFGYGAAYDEKKTMLGQYKPNEQENYIKKLISNSTGKKFEFNSFDTKFKKGKSYVNQSTPLFMLKDGSYMKIIGAIENNKTIFSVIHQQINPLGKKIIVFIRDEYVKSPVLHDLFKTLLTTFIKTGKH